MIHDDYRLIRIQAGIKQGDMAKRLSVSQAQLSQYEKHGVPLSRKAMEKLVKIISKLSAKED